MVCLRSRGPPGGPRGPREGPLMALGGLPGAPRTPRARAKKPEHPYFLQGPTELPRLGRGCGTRPAHRWRNDKSGLGFWPIFGPLGPTAGPGSPGEGPGSKNSAGCTTNQPCMPILRPVRGYFVFLGPTQPIERFPQHQSFGVQTSSSLRETHNCGWGRSPPPQLMGFSEERGSLNPQNLTFRQLINGG